MPVRPTMSARAQRSKSIGWTFSSTRVTVCSGGVSAASSGRLATGRIALTPRNGIACSRPQYEISKRGLIRTISAMSPRLSPGSLFARWPGQRRRGAAAILNQRAEDCRGAVDAGTLAAGRHHRLWHQLPDQRNDLRFLFDGFEELLDQGNGQHPVLPQHVGLRPLSLGNLLELEFLALSAKLCRVPVLLGDLNADHRFDELVLLLGSRSRLFGLDPLRLRLLLLLVGDLQLIGQLLAQPRNQQLRRQCRITELDLLDDDPRPQSFGSDRILDGVLEGGSIVGEI